MSEFLIVVMDDLVPGLLLRPDLPAKIEWHDQELKDTGIRTLVGFYDWLRTDEKEVIGVRLTIMDDEVDYLTSEVSQKSYVEELPESVGFEMFFTEERNYDLESSNDQDFFDVLIYRSETGLLALSFDAGWALDSLKKLAI